MKKGFGIAALALATGCAVIFAGCAGCNGCGNKGKKNEAAFSSNWYADTGYRYIQPTFNVNNEETFKSKEILTYSVTFDKKSASNSTYSVDYAEGGTYTTAFYATTFDKGLLDGNYTGTYPENDITVYCYETALEVPSITFTVGKDTSEPVPSSITTKCYFMDVNNHLRPLYSEQIINTVSPAEYQVSSLEQAYIEINQEIKTYYNYRSTAAKTVITGYKATTFTTNVGDTDNSLIDVSGLNIAVRAMQLSTSLSQVISLYSPSGRMQSYTFTGSSGSFGEEERKGYEGILEGKNLYVGGEGKSLKTVCVTAELNTDMNGVSQKYWFAAINSAKNNTGRATMVKMSVPLPFSLGTLNYSLTGITSTLY